MANQTLQPQRDRNDVRKLQIIDEGNALRVVAYFENGDILHDFKGYWYCWQIGGRNGVVWSPIGHNQSSIQKPNATEVHVYKYPQEDSSVDHSNINAVWAAKT